MAHARGNSIRAIIQALWYKSLREEMVDEASRIQLDYLQKTLHDQQKRVEDVEQAIIDLAKRLEAIEEALACKA